MSTTDAEILSTFARDAERDRHSADYLLGQAIAHMEHAAETLRLVLELGISDAYLRGRAERDLASMTRFVREGEL